MAKYKGKYRSLARKLDRLIEKGIIGRAAERHSDYEDNDDMYGRLVGGGFRLLGNGYYSSVFTHYRAPGVVFKHTWDNEDSMLVVAAAFQELQHENLPVVHLIHSASTPDGPTLRHMRTHGVVVCERLSTSPENLFLEGMYEARAAAQREVEDALDQYGIRCTDMHGANFMWRGNTCIVNDPTTYVRKR